MMIDGLSIAQRLDNVRIFLVYGVLNEWRRAAFARLSTKLDCMEYGKR